MVGHGDVAEVPAAIEVRRQRAVEAHVGEPVLSGDGLQPVAVPARRGSWPELQIDRPVVVADEVRIARAAVATLLGVVDQAARADVVDGDDQNSFAGGSAGTWRV